MKVTQLQKKGKWGIEDWRSDLFRYAKKPIPATGGERR
jgi:hypothetical protein